MTNSHHQSSPNSSDLIKWVDELKTNSKFSVFFCRSFRSDPSSSISSGSRPTDNKNSNRSKSRSIESLTDASMQFRPLIEEVHISPIVSRRGYLNFIDDKETNWLKRFVVRRQNLCWLLQFFFFVQIIRRPFVFIYNHEKDSVERALINLTTARIELNDEDASKVIHCRYF